MRQVLGQTELNWAILGFQDDDEKTTRMRLKQANLVGPAGYISMEDGAVGGFVQRAIRGRGRRVSHGDGRARPHVRQYADDGSLRAWLLERVTAHGCVIA